MKHFSDRLRYARTLRNLSQAELARASGLSQGAISSYETRARKATTGIIELAQALNVSPVWLSTGTGPMETSSDTALGNANKTELHDVQQEPVSVTWPFSTIKLSDFWSLPEHHRQTVEQTMSAMITSLLNSPDNKKR